MKKLLFLCLALCAVIAAKAQELPYSKYIYFSKAEFKENNFKYDNYTNTWGLTRTNGLNVALNVLAIIADADDDVRPASGDYSIAVQMGVEDKVSSIYVVFYKDETYHKLLSFMMHNCDNFFETSSGKVVKQHAIYEDYSIELCMEQHIISRTSSRTIDYKSVKSVDESYNEYTFVINTGVEPTSRYLDKQAAKQAKRDAKGMKKRNVEDMM